MTRKIIQHHENFDFETLFRYEESRYTGIDLNGCLSLLNGADETHSFIGCDEGDSRVKNAIKKALSAEEAEAILAKADSVVVSMVHSQSAERPVTIDETMAINDLIGSLPKGCNAIWGGVSNDVSMGNAVRIIILANIKN